MKKETKVLIGIAAVVLLLIFWFVGTQNRLVALREDVKMQQAQIEVALQRRIELIPDLVEVVKKYASHEETVFTEIAEARSKLAGSIQGGDFESINQATDAFDSALSRLLVITENYPDLKASEQFIGLQDELAGTANRISVARNYYNEKAQAYNTAIQTLPTSIIAGMLGHHPIPYYQANEEAYKTSVVNFD